MTTRGRHPRRMKWVETCGAAHVEADDVLALRVRQENGLGTRRNPELLPVSTLSRIFEREGSPWAAAVAVEVGGGM